MPVDVDELARIGAGQPVTKKAEKPVPVNKAAQKANIQTVDDLATIGGGGEVKKKVGSEENTNNTSQNQSTVKLSGEAVNDLGVTLGDNTQQPKSNGAATQIQFASIPKPKTAQEKLVDEGKNIVAKKEALNKSVDIFNNSYGTKFTPDEVFSNPDKASEFLDLYKSKVSQAEFDINSKLQPRNIISSSESYGQPTRPPISPTVIPNYDLLSKAGLNEKLLSDHVVDLSVDEGRLKGLPKKDVVNNLFKRLDPKEYQRLSTAVNERATAGLTDIVSGGPFSGDNTKAFELLNTEKAPYELAYNESIRRQANNLQVMGTLNKDQSMIDAGKSIAAQVQSDDDIYAKSPTLNKSRIAADISNEIAGRIGQLQGTEAAGFNNVMDKLGLDNNLIKNRTDVLQTEAFQKYYNNPATRDAALEVAANPENYLSDATYFGGVAKNIAKPFKELGLSVLDITGIRDKMDRLNETKNEELFPEVTPQLKGYVSKIKGAINTTSYLTGMMALQIPGTALGAAAGLGEVAATRTGTAMAFGIPSFDANLKDADNFLENDGAKAAYATVGAMINTVGGEFLELGKISKFSELQKPLLNLSEKMTDKNITTTAVNELLDKAKDPYIDVMMKYGTNVTKGAATMSYFTFANGVNKMLFSGNETTTQLVENTGTAFVDGVLGMAVLGGFGANADMKKEKNTTYKNNIYQWANNSDAARDVIETAYKTGEYSRPQYNEKVQILNTSIAAKNNLAIAEAGNNVTLNEQQKAVYVANRTAEGVIKKQLESPLLTEQQKTGYENQIKRLQTQREDILKGLTFNDNLEPLDAVFKAQIEYKKAYEDFNEGVVENDSQVIAAKENLQKAIDDNGKSTEPISTTTESAVSESEKAKNDMAGLSHADWFLKNKEKFPEGDFNRINTELTSTDESVKQKAIDEIISKKDEVKNAGTSTETTQSIQPEVAVSEVQTNESQVPTSTDEAGQVNVESTTSILEKTDANENQSTIEDTKQAEGQNTSNKTISENSQTAEIEKAKDLVNSGVVKGFTSDVLKDAANNDVEGFKGMLKEISEQAQDPRSEPATVKTYGQELVDIANELNPKEDISSQSKKQSNGESNGEKNDNSKSIPKEDGKENNHDNGKEKTDVKNEGAESGKTDAAPSKKSDTKNLFEGENAATNKKEFDKMTSDIPNGGEIKKYLSGDTIKKYESGTELRNNQEITAQELEPALKHGVDTINKAKEIFGDEYVAKTLDYIDRENINPENKALLYVSLENDLAKRVAEEPDNLDLKKKQDLVRTKSQAFLRSSSLAINMGRLRKFAEAGYDISKVTDKFFSSKEREQKTEVEKLVQADADTIQKQAEENYKASNLSDAEIEAKVKEGVDTEIAKLYEALPKEKKTAADKAIAALDKVQQKLRNKSYSDATGIVAFIDAGITTMKAAIKAGVKIADAVEMGIAKIKEKYGKEWPKEDEFRKDVLEGLKSEGAIEKERAKQSAKEYRVLETERNRQLKKVGELKDRLSELQKGIKPESDKKEAKKDVPEIEDLKKQVKDAEKELQAIESQSNRIKELESELDRLQNRLPKEVKESMKRQITDKEAELRFKIDAEKEAIRKDEKYERLFGNKNTEEKTQSERLADAKEKINNDIEVVREEILRKQRVNEKSKDKLQDDQELTRLREHKKTLENLRDTYLGQDQERYKNEKALNHVKDRLTKEVMDINKQINEGQKTVKDKKEPLTNPEIDALKAEKETRQSILEAIDPTPNEYVEDALIKQGFGKTINVKTKDGVVEKQVLDWKKLAGEEGSVSNISKHVAEVMKDSGFTTEQLDRMSDSFIKEYTDLRTSVIQKGLNEIAARNKTTVTPDQKSAAKKLAEMYNYGLFDKDLEGYETALAKTIGVDKLNADNLKEALVLGKAISQLLSSRFQGERLTESQMRSAIQVIENEMRHVLHSEATAHGSTALKIADVARTYMDLTQRMTLNSLKQAAENPLSGGLEQLFTKLGYQSAIPDVLSKQASKIARGIYKEMVLQKGQNFGEVSSTFVNKGNLEMELDKMTDNQVIQGVLSTMIGRTTLDAVDSMYKAKITQQKFTYNLIKILQEDRMIDGKIQKGMSKQEAKNYVAEKLTGQSFKEAQETAKNIIDHINKDAGRKIFNDSQLFVDRLANDIVTAALVNGEKISEEMVSAAYNSAYKAAGRGLGHVANNFISEGIGSVSGKLESKINEAVKEKEYKKAAMLTYASIFFRNIANPFVGGGTNWVVLKAEKSGLGLLSGLGSMMYGGRKMDLTSEAGVNDLERAMYQNLKVKDKFLRGAIGGAATVVGAMIMAGVTTTDEYRKWRLKNKWAAKYLDLVTPEIVLAGMAKESKQLKYYFETAFNKNDAFDKGTMAVNAMTSALSNERAGNKKDTPAGKFGKLAGSMFGAPTPWRLIRDVDQIWTGAEGGEPYKVDNSPSQSFLEGYFKGGMIDYMGYAPKP